MTPPKRVLIFGGTHGNEWIGVVAVTKFADALREEFKDLDLHFIHANPEAYQLNRRFKDEDLNRAFQYIDRQKESYEHMRAKELCSTINESPCFILDLHTTTSNMGKTVIISRPETYNLQIASQLTEVKVIISPDPDKKYLVSQSPYGMIIEVGPVAHGVIEGSALENTVCLIQQILKLISTNHNPAVRSLQAYEEIENIYYPQDGNGEITSYIHKNFQGRDFSLLEGRYTPFKSFKGEDQTRIAEEKLYPIFINEAAYYPTKLAYTLCQKRIVEF